jgi:hypothetical protein
MVSVHPELGAIGLADLRRLNRLFRPFSAPRRLLVQWVPHGFGYRSMNLWFCLWIAQRAWLGDRVELMVHEPFVEFRGPLRYRMMACVHRLMTVILLRATCQVWMSIPGWEKHLRPYALGRSIPMEWLPLPVRIPLVAATEETRLRTKYAANGQVLVGHFGTFGSTICALLEDRLPGVMESAAMPALLLIGAGSEVFRRRLIDQRPAWAMRVHATGHVPASELGGLIAACDVFVKPYPDGVSSRRTSALMCLAQGRPVVTTSGHLTEPFWAETGAVVLAGVLDVSGFVSGARRLLQEPMARLQSGEQGQRLCRERFTLSHVVQALRAA